MRNPSRFLCSYLFIAALLSPLCANVVIGPEIFISGILIVLLGILLEAYIISRLLKKDGFSPGRMLTGWIFINSLTWVGFYAGINTVEELVSVHSTISRIVIILCMEILVVFLEAFLIMGLGRISFFKKEKEPRLPFVRVLRVSFAANLASAAYGFLAVFIYEMII